MRLYAPPITNLNQITTRNHVDLALLSANDHPQYALLSAVNTFLAAADWGSNKLTTTYVPLNAADLVNKLYADAAGSKRLDTMTTPISFTTSTAENTVYTYAMPANKLGTLNAVKLRAYFSNVHSFNTEGFTIRYKMNGTTFASFSYGFGVTFNAPAMQDVWVLGAGTTSSQRIMGTSIDSTTQKVGGTQAIDGTAIITFTITTQLNTTGGSENITLDSVLTEWAS